MDALLGIRPAENEPMILPAVERTVGKGSRGKRAEDGKWRNRCRKHQ